MIEKMPNKRRRSDGGIIEGEIVERTVEAEQQRGGVVAREAKPGLGDIPVAAFDIGEVVRHRHFPFRGVIFDVDPEFANSEEWWLSIPEAIRPAKNQPFYHLLAENEEAAYIAYVSQQNLLRDDSEQPVHHPAIPQMFGAFEGGRYILRREHAN